MAGVQGLGSMAGGFGGFPALLHRAARGGYDMGSHLGVSQPQAEASVV